MAEIFKGRALDSQGLEKTVVIKRILPNIAASPEFVEMLIDEAKIAVLLTHGNIAQVYDLGKVGDDYFIVMEYVEGKTFSQMMKRLRTQGLEIPISCAAAVIREIAEGLDYMHRKADDNGQPLGIIHRDISPQNIILSTSGTVKIIDFGIAKAQSKVSSTDSGVLKGKFAYMSPEHANGEGLDQRTDIFSLGVVLFELLTGQRLFKGKNNADSLKRVRKAKVPTPSELRPDIPCELDEIILKSLKKERRKRYQTAHDFAQDLTRFLVKHDASFSPRDLITFLQGLFPELVPALERPPQEPIIRAALKEMPDSKGQAPEDISDPTIHAESQLIRQKLKESEVFSVPDRKKEPSLSGKSDGSSREMPIHRVSGFQNARSLPWKRIGAGLSLVLITAGLAWAGWRLKPIFISWWENLQEALREENVVATPEPEPAPKKIEVPPENKPRPPAAGTLIIESRPNGARIFLNDQDTNFITPATLQDVPASRPVKIGLHKERYRFWERSTQAMDGSTARVSADLELNHGDLEINSLPTGAQVYLNGKESGKTPLIRTQVEPNTAYDVTLKLHGYEDWQGKVKVFGGKREVVSASLKRLPLE